MTDRELNGSLFYLRCLQVGLSIEDTDLLTVGEILDMFTESANDKAEYNVIAGQEDFNRF